MHTPDQNREGDLPDLLSAMTETRLNDAGRKRLAELIRNNPEGRRQYLEHCQMHALLLSSHGVLHAQARSVGRRSIWNRTKLTAMVAFPVAACLLLMVWKSTSSTAALQFVVESTHGDVLILRDGQRVPAVNGERLKVGERVVTGSNGSANVRLADGTNIDLAHSTEIGFATERVLTKIQLRLGSIHCSVVKQRAGNSLVFQTPHTEVTVLGTIFDLTTSPVESRLHVVSGRVRSTGGGQSVEVAAGEVCTADMQGVQGWQTVCDLDFTTLDALPDALETVFCDSPSLHTAQRKIVPAPNEIRLEDGGLWLRNSHRAVRDFGLMVARWREAIGGDVAIEVDISAGEKWTLGMAVDGDSFEGYRIIFVAPNYPNGISVDSVYPVEAMLLAQDPRPLPSEGDHTLRVEKHGEQLRVWFDRELRIDTALSYALSPTRKRTFAISTFGNAPKIRALRVWKGI